MFFIVNRKDDDGAGDNFSLYFHKVLSLLGIDENKTLVFGVL
jgi:hypothetical protein